MTRKLVARGWWAELEFDRMGDAMLLLAVLLKQGVDATLMSDGPNATTVVVRWSLMD